MKSPRRSSRTSRVSRARARSAASAADVSPAPSPRLPSGFNLSSAEIEKALVAGTHVALLEAYFGEDNYAELHMLARQAASRTVRGGQRVLILPGTMGTKLGVPGAGLFGTSDVLWLDPIDIAMGRLDQLSLRGGNSAIKALEPIYLYYLKLKFRLRSAGLDADFWGYDWRQDIDDTSDKLVAALAKEPAKEIYLVAHSMGGLISRAALKKDGSKVKRLVMLGTPNHGAFLAAQAIRGTLGSIRKLATLDLRHTPEELCEQAFNTFPSTYELLPDPEKFSKFDLFDPNFWPKGGAAFDSKLLANARRTQSLLAPSDERFALIAGVNQKTVVDIDSVGGDFVYSENQAGDGTVPLDLALLSGTPTWYVEEEHGSLPNNAAVARAVTDILNTGTTQQLPQEWHGDRCAPGRKISDTELRAAFPDSKRRGEISSREFREILAPFLSSDANDSVPNPATTIAMAAPFASVRPLELNQVVVGRRRQKRLEICIAEGDVTEVNSRAIVLGLFREVAPGGAALALDERLDGAIAEFVNRRMFSGNVGELFILPTGRHPIQADLVLFAGLGAFDNFNFEILQLVAENTIRTLIRTNVEDFATVLLGSGTGIESVDSLRHLLEGFVKGIRDVDTDAGVRRVTFCVRDPDKCREIGAELFRLAGTGLFADIEVSFETKVLPATIVRDRGLQPVAGPALTEPAYLIVRQEGTSADTLLFRSSLLTAGAKATVITGQRTVSASALAKQLRVLGTTSFGADDMDGLGETLAKELLSDEVLAVLPSVADGSLIIVHDAAAGRIPWELLHVGGHTPVLEGGITRRYLADNLSVAKWLESRRQHPKLKMLLVVNPSRGESMSLEGAEEEGKRVQKLFATDPSIEITLRAGAQATRAALIQDFRSGEYDLVHYAGHAYFDAQEPSRSGILCHGQEVLSGADLAGLGNLPNLVVFNACESARIRSASAKPKPADLAPKVEKATGMAEAFLRGGVANYVGTYWSVGDAAAVTFANTFYPALLRGLTVGDALLAARREVKAKDGTVDWADYIHYGNQNFVLKTKS